VSVNAAAAAAASLKNFFLSEMLKYFISSSFSEEQSVRESRFGFSFFLLFLFLFLCLQAINDFTHFHTACSRYAKVW
jgi:hypothetical protein